MPPESYREPNPSLSWEGDHMFNIYIYDYCSKRGFRNTARQLKIEAALDDTNPPINARQGLLFEWWSVFWVLFQTKSSNLNHEDALLYIQHQNTHKAARMQPLPAQQQPGVPIPLGNQPPQSSSNPQSQPQAPIRGMPNGMPLQRQPPPYHTNGAIHNGINPAMGGQPTQPGQMAQQPMQGQLGGTLNFGGIGSQVGAAQQPPQPQGVSQQSGSQAMSFNPMMSGAGTQRPPINGQLQQPGQQQPRGPFTSPPMAHSPQGGAAGGQPTSQGPPPGQPGQAPMAHLGPSPQMTPMSRSMLPPNGAPPASMAGPMNLTAPQQGPPNGGFNPGQGPPQGQGPNPAAARPPSRSRPTPSPSMSARQPPGAGPQQQGGMGMMMSMGPIQGMPAMGGMNLGGMAGVGGNLNLDHEIQSIPHMTFTSLKRELGYGEKDLNTGEKAHIVNVWRHRSGPPQQARKDVSGMAGTSPGMLPPGQPQVSQQMQQRPQHPQPSGPRLKRSPSEDLQNEPRNESSPPDRKRMKRSPAEQPAVPPGYPQHVQPGQPGSIQPPAPTPQQNTSMQLNAQPGQPGPGGTLQGPMSQQQAHMMMRMLPGVNGPAPGPPGQGKHGGTVGQTPTGPQAAGMPMHPSQMPPPNHFRGGPPGPAATAKPSAASQFHSIPLTQLAAKPHVGMPANSPGMNGPSKDTKEKPPQSNGQPQPGPDMSPRNTATGTAPPTPGASNHPTPGLPPSSLPPGSSAQPPTPQQPPAMSGMLSMDIPGMTAGDFMFESTLMEDFDGDINFERDFGQWFNSTEDGANLQLK